jgi:hypothetical protein
MNPSSNMITDGGGALDHLFPFSPPRFDPSFFTPVRSTLSLWPHQEVVSRACVGWGRSGLNG